MASYSNNIEIKSSGRHTNTSTTSDLVTLGTKEFAEITIIHQDNSSGSTIADTTFYTFMAGETTVFGLYVLSNDIVAQIGATTINFGVSTDNKVSLSYVVKGNA